MNGFIFLHRTITESEWYQDGNTIRVFIHCLLKANHKPNRWRGTLVKRGQFISSPEILGKELLLSRQQMRTSINKLKSTSNLTTKSTNKFTLYEVINYDNYQSDNHQINQQPNQRVTNKQPTNNQQITTNNNDNNDNNKNTSTNVDEKLNSNSNSNEKFSPLSDCVEKKEKGGAAEQESSSTTEHGNPGVNEILKTIQGLLGVTDFKESKKQQRIWGSNLMRLRDGLGRKEFSGRFLALQSDPFHLKNMGSLQYIYRQIKGFVGTVSPKSDDVKFYNPDEDERFRD